MTVWWNHTCSDDCLVIISPDLLHSRLQQEAPEEDGMAGIEGTKTEDDTAGIEGTKTEDETVGIEGTKTENPSNE